MKKIHLYKSILYLSLFLNSMIGYCQTFKFDPLQSAANCGSNSYQLATTFYVKGIKITNIYWDSPAQNNGSFSFEIIFNYENIFTGQPPSSTPYFWTYSYALHTSNSSIGSSTVQNNISNVPIASNNGGTMYSTTNNITYNGSASTLGFNINQTYTDAATLALFNIDAATLTVGLPCLNATTSTINSEVLPIELSNFEVMISNNEAIIVWTTASELNHKEFNIEKSNDAINWSSIATITSKADNGNSNEILNYSFIDSNPVHGMNYYRLKIIGLDESIDYSDIIEIDYIPFSNSEISVYPNPAHGEIFIKNIRANSIIELLNMQGALLFKNIVNTSGTYNLNLPALAAGTYYIKITNPEHKISYKKIQINY